MIPLLALNPLHVVPILQLYTHTHLIHVIPISDECSDHGRIEMLYGYGQRCNTTVRCGMLVYLVLKQKLHNIISVKETC